MVEHQEQNIKHKSNTNNKTVTYEQYNPNLISFNVIIQRSNNERFFNANQYNIQATEKDDHANANHLYHTAGADYKESDLQSKPF